MAQAKTKKVEKSAASEVKGSIHPKQHKINVVMTDKSEFEILSTWGKEGDVLKLDIDPKNHPAWQKNASVFVNANDERISKFKKKFGDFGF